MVKQRHSIEVDAVVVLPDHSHTLWTLPPGGCDYSTRWMLIKVTFSRDIKGVHRNTSRIFKKGRGIWQRRYWDI